MATQRVQIPISFQYLNGSGDLIPIPTGTALTIVDRNTGNPAVVFSGLIGPSTISSPVTDSGGNVPGFVVQGSYAITASANLGATPPFSGATIDYEAVRGDGVENIFPGAITSSALAAGSVALSNLVSALQQMLVPTGMVTDFAGSVAPTGWHLCDGSVQLQTGTFAALFAAIGSAFNTGGEGSGHFRLPNTQGRFTLAAGGGLAGHTNLNDRGGALNHTHGLGAVAVTTNLGTPAVTVNVPGLLVPGHTHPLSGNGGAQVRALADARSAGLYILSGQAGPFFNSAGFAFANANQTSESGSSSKGAQQSYGLIGNTDTSSSFTTNGATASGSVNGGQTAPGTINGGQNTQTGDPAYIVLNKIIKI